jgi:S-adenosylmethionine:tRNA ribosyltransferase-isomerase
VELSLFDYELPPDRIAQYPAEVRDQSRLLVLDRTRDRLSDRVFTDLPDLLRPGDCLIINDSRVIPARVFGHLQDDREVELLFLREQRDGRWEILGRPARRLESGVEVALSDGQSRVRVIERGSWGRRIVTVDTPAGVRSLLERHGFPPLPPYIRRFRKPEAEDWERYQAVYARHPGSVAAPTAGLHFTRELLETLGARRIECHPLTLHVGPGTFRPIRAQRVEDHQMEAEWVTIPGPTAEAISRAKAEARRVIAVGTTVTRALESITLTRPLRAFTGWVDLFITPGHPFRVLDGLVTNFHLPRSSLLVLVSAFAGRECVLAAYRHAISTGYRFYSYGDAMLIA